MSKPKFGAGHAAAMARLGLKELRNAANPSRESVADNEIGLYGTLTQGEIAEARDGPGAGSQQESRREALSLAELRGYAAEKAKDAEQRMEQGHSQDRGDIER
jgi:hypothetical protein